MGLRKFFLNNEPLVPYLVQQVTGALLGFLIAIVFDAGPRLAGRILNEPRCSIGFKDQTSMGFFYDLKIKIPTKESGIFLLYPKHDVLLRLATLKHSNRVMSSEEIEESKDRNEAKGMVLAYIDGEEEISVDVEVFSDQMWPLKNQQEAKCEDLLAKF